MSWGSLRQSLRWSLRPSLRPSLRQSLRQSLKGSLRGSLGGVAFRAKILVVLVRNAFESLARTWMVVSQQKK